jgi:hypothetical protein
MNILIGDLEFEGPWNAHELVSPEPGILAVLYEKQGEFELVELVESDNLADTALCLLSQSSELPAPHLTIHVAAHYTADLTAQERTEIVEELLDVFDREPLTSPYAVA